LCRRPAKNRATKGRSASGPATTPAGRSAPAPERKNRSGDQVTGAGRGRQSRSARQNQTRIPSTGPPKAGEPQPVVKVKAIYHRNNPILDDQAPLWPGAVRFDLNLRAGLLWDQLESAGIQDVVGVYGHSNYLYAVSIRQRYAGHARQAAHAVIACSAAARHGRYVVVVDEDIDPTNLKEVLWAMMTRVDPATDIETIDGCWSTPLDPRMPPEKRKARDHSNSRAIFYAVRPFSWRDKFPRVSRTGRELFDKVVQDYGHILPFPKR